MSRMTTSGRKAAAASRAAGPEWAVWTSWPSISSSAIMISAVSSLSSTTSTRRGRARGGSAGSAGASSGEAGCSRAGSRTTNSLPLPSPSLWASRVPPCSSTSRRERVRPIPRPSRERSSERSPWVKRSKMRGSRSVAMPTPVSFTRSTTSCACALGGAARCCRRPR